MRLEVAETPRMVRFANVLLDIARVRVLGHYLRPPPVPLCDGCRYAALPLLISGGEPEERQFQDTRGNDEAETIVSV